MEVDLIKALSCAKLNLTLKILNKDVKGYHNIATYFQLINLYDEIEINFVKANTFKVTNVIEGINNFLDALEIKGFESINLSKESNLIYKAIKLLCQNIDSDTLLNSELLNYKLIINVKKQIVDKGGLGGGSSNASRVLLVIRDKFFPHLSNEFLKNVSFLIGCDCPIFIHGQSDFAWDYGQTFNSTLSEKYYKHLFLEEKNFKNFRESLSDDLKRLAIYNYKRQSCEVVLLFPKINVSTKEAFENLSSVSTNSLTRNRDEVIEASKAFIGTWENDFQDYFIKKAPSLKDFWIEFKNYASLTGTGSTIFIPIFNDKEEVLNKLKPYIEKGLFNIVITKTIV